MLHSSERAVTVTVSQHASTGNRRLVSDTTVLAGIHLTETAAPERAVSTAVFNGRGFTSSMSEKKFLDCKKITQCDSERLRALRRYVLILPLFLKLLKWQENPPGTYKMQENAWRPMLRPHRAVEAFSTPQTS